LITSCSPTQGEEEPERAAEGPEGKAFDEKFPGDLPPTSTEGGADGELRPAGFGTNQNPGGHVRAGEQE